MIRLDRFGDTRVVQTLITRTRVNTVHTFTTIYNAFGTTCTMDIDAEDYLMAPGMDNEPSQSASDQSDTSRHRITNGYEICTHICTGGTCTSKKTNTILWHKEGHAARKHVCSKKMHPKCGIGVFADCPGRLCIEGKGPPGAGVQDATDEELYHYLGIRFDTPMAEVPKVDTHPSFKLIYIPDAAMRIYSKEKAQNDLGFIPTVLSESEYEPLRQLKGSIHVISKGKAKNSNITNLKVVMQEWVSTYIG
jgi:hypothetical protein